MTGPSGTGKKLILDAPPGYPAENRDFQQKMPQAEIASGAVFSRLTNSLLSAFT